MVTTKVQTEIGGKVLSIETGKLAKQASGSALVKFGDVVVLCTAVGADPRDGIDFFPLTVDYREKMYAAGKFPGGFFKREGRPSQKETLTMRAIDRPIRPLFPEGYMNEVQLQCWVLSADGENDPDVFAMIGASSALMNSHIPFEGPTAAVRVCRVGDELVLNPTVKEREAADFEMLLAGHKDGINMIEVGAREVPEDFVVEAIEFGHEAIIQICDMIQELADKVAPPKSWTPPKTDADLAKRVHKLTFDKMRKAKSIKGKQERNEAVKAVYDAVLAELCPPDEDAPTYNPKTVKALAHEVEGEVVRRSIIEDGVRSDGRGLDDLRDLYSEVSVLPRTHGSSLFTRGETQSLVTLTLGTARDEQIVDDLGEEYSRKFMLHYNFPPFSVGEARRIMGPGRRELGHGALAERALEGVMPNADQFPYTVRLVSEILESNGSSSMASVCGGTLALMDGGVPIVHPVAGISVGLIRQDNKNVLITDILGEEDHFGDMDFKVAGSQFGVTAIQLDLKTRGLDYDIIRRTLAQARAARIKILKHMLSVMREPRGEISNYAPNLVTVKIDPEKIGRVIGPGGAGIRKIQGDTGTDIDIQDDGTVTIAGVGHEGPNRAKELIELITVGAKVGAIYEGRVTSVKEFGAFIEISPGQDGMCHISELDNGYVAKVSDVCKVGDVLRVKVIAVDDHGRVKLSRKILLQEEGGGSDNGGGDGDGDSGDRPQRDGGDSRGGREGGRGGRGGRGGSRSGGDEVAAGSGAPTGEARPEGGREGGREGGGGRGGRGGRGGPRR